MHTRARICTALLAISLPLTLTSCSNSGDAPTGPVVSTPSGAFTWTQADSARSGVVQTHTLVAGGTAGRYTLTLNAATAAGGSISNNDLITLTLINLSGTGTYDLGINAASGVLASATITRNRIGSPAAIWGFGPGLGGGVGSGRVIISSFNATARTVSGTFTFVGGPVTNTGSISTVAVTGGAFNVTIP